MIYGSTFEALFKCRHSDPSILRSSQQNYFQSPESIQSFKKNFATSVAFKDLVTNKKKHPGNFLLRILTGKKHPKIKLQPLRKRRILIFGSLVHKINSFEDVLKTEQIFEKNK